MGFQLREGKPDIQYQPETSGTADDWAAGDPVYLVSGRLLIAAGTGAAAVYGIAMAPATGTEDNQIPVSVMTPEQIWSIEVDGATTPAQITHVGVEYSLTIATGATVLDLASGTAAGFQVQSLDRRDTAAAGTRVQVKIEPASCQARG